MMILLLLTTTASAQWGTTADAKAEAFGKASSRVVEDFDSLLNDAKPQRCRVTYYHPREAGGDWRRWANCRTLGSRDMIPGPGGKVRPGVACVQVSRWRAWQGKLLAVEGQGLVQVLDADSHRGRASTIWFDLAVPGPPWLYEDWLANEDRVSRARHWSGYARFFEIAPAEVLGLLQGSLGSRQETRTQSILEDSLSTTPPASG